MGCMFVNITTKSVSGFWDFQESLKMFQGEQLFSDF